ncbi:MAG: heme exporter protein CcmD [Sneathiellaceae bacterium]
MDFPGRFDSFGAFLAMGGHGAYVWPALGLALLVLLGLWLQSLAALRAAERQEALVGRLRKAPAGGRAAAEERSDDR